MATTLFDRIAFVGTRFHDSIGTHASAKFYMINPTGVHGTFHVVPKIIYAGDGSVGDWHIAVMHHANGSFLYGVRRQKPNAGIAGTYGFLIHWSIGSIPVTRPPP